MSFKGKLNQNNVPEPPGFIGRHGASFFSFFFIIKVAYIGGTGFNAGPLGFYIHSCPFIQ